MRSRWLHRLVVFVAGNLGLLAVAAEHLPRYMEQQHCEPVVRR